MINFLRSIYIETFTENGWIGFVLGILVWATSFLLAGTIFALSVWLVDSSFMPVKEGHGVVVNKYVVAAHTTTTLMMSGKVMIPITTHHSTQWKLEVEVDGLVDDVSVREAYYERVPIGKRVYCQYTNGRIKESLYIKHLID